jgi:hypothetical protein
MLNSKLECFVYDETVQSGQIFAQLTAEGTNKSFIKFVPVLIFNFFLLQKFSIFKDKKYIKLGATTLCIMTVSITKLCDMTFSITTLFVKTFIVTTLSLMTTSLGVKEVAVGLTDMSSC